MPFELQPSVFWGPPVSTSMDFNESIFGPLHRKGKSRLQPQKSPQREQLLNDTQFNESIIAPIVAAKKVEKEKSECAVGVASHGDQVGGEKRKKCRFELIMEAWEKSSMKAKADQSEDKEHLEAEKDVNPITNLNKQQVKPPTTAHPPPATFVPSHISEPTLPTSGAIPSYAASKGVYNEVKDQSAVDISVLHEVKFHSVGNIYD